jgi:PEP-CTERM/exosortase A-associated glycosyltransferase
VKILHILDHYKPHFSGYVFRTSYILKYQQEIGLEPVCVTSPKQGIDYTDLQEIDDVRIYRTPQAGFGDMPFIKEVRSMKALQKRIEKVISVENPDIIHAHSPSLNGIPALKAGRRYNIPVVYEARAFWEDAAVDHRTFKESSFKYRVSRFIETRLLKKVDAIFTISEGMRKEMIARGISEKQITIIPNGVDTKQFSTIPRDGFLSQQKNIKGKKVLGFIGSFYHYEGIDLLIDAFAEILKKNNNVVLLLVGEGPEYTKIREMTDKKGLNGCVIFTGKVPHQEIQRYYSVMDILVYPRKSMRLTELVTPLKPLEAMALGKVVAGSSVGGIREMIKDGGNGILFKPDSIESLAVTLSELISNPALQESLSQEAVMYVNKERSWDKIIQRYLLVYERVTRMKN